MNAFDYAASHREEFLAQLQDFLRIPSISTLPEHRGDIRRASEWVADQLRLIGMRRVEIYPTAGHPIVYADWLGAPSAPTILIYGHYDVQPVDPIEEWRSAPFEPEVRAGNLYARGGSDDKGQLFVHLKSVESLLYAHAGKLPISVKFLIEGEEEVVSTNLDLFIETHQDLLRADITVISDEPILAIDRPCITYGTRGLTYLELEITGPKSDMHSGLYGGTVDNPAQVLCAVIAALHHADGSVAVPGFYGAVRALSAMDRAMLAKIAWTEEEWRAETGAPRSWGEASYSLRERVGLRPTLEVNGLVSGFTGQGAKTIIPARALAKISCRLVPDQDPHEIEKLIRHYVQSLTPPTVTSEIRGLSYGHPAIVPVDSPAMNAAVAAYERGFGATPVFRREGGSLPILATLQRLFDMPVLLLGFGLPDDNIHAPNEKFAVECFQRGIITSIALLEGLSA
jgi:acetylornithine deacetylase/succinyl-diaminopimelate desuccinylase-like protein